MLAVIVKRQQTRHCKIGQGQNKIKMTKNKLETSKFYDDLSATWDKTRPKYTEEIFRKRFGNKKKLYIRTDNQSTINLGFGPKWHIIPLISTLNL